MKISKKSKSEEKTKKKHKKESLLRSGIIGASTPPLGRIPYRPGEKDWVFD